MATTLKDFLQRESEKYHLESIANKATVVEWRESVERLFQQLRTWLGESDPGHAIEIKETTKEISEPGIGRYEVPCLTMRAFDKRIGIIPKARRTVGMAKPPRKNAPERADGRVDITDEVQRHILYRFKEDGADYWMIDDLDSDPKALDQAAFESAILSYLI